MLDRFTAQSKNLENKKEKKVAKLKSQHLKVLVDYLDEDFAETKKAYVGSIKKVSQANIK